MATLLLVAPQPGAIFARIPGPNILERDFANVKGSYGVAQRKLDNRLTVRLDP